MLRIAGSDMVLLYPPARKAVVMTLMLLLYDVDWLACSLALRMIFVPVVLESLNVYIVVLY